MKVPFNRPSLAGKELDYIQEAVSLGQLAGDGNFTIRCQNKLSAYIGANAVLLTHSCTAALEMAAILIGVEPGDEVIMPSYTFVSTANAVALRRGIPVFVDIRPDTLNIDEDLIESAITSRTKAIFPVHYAGVPAEMDRIVQIANRHSLYVVEDAAQALGSTYNGRKAGSLGHLAAFSFHETKNIISGEGGALAINDGSLLERAEIIREKGTNRKRFFRGQVDKYTWVDVGSSFLPGELIAAFLCAQLDELDTIGSNRMASWTKYDDALQGFASRGVRTPIVPPGRTHNAHLYYIILPTPEMRQKLIALLRQDGINAPFHYVPLHNSPAGTKLARTSGDLFHTQDLSERLVRLPLYPHIDSQLDYVIERVIRHLDALL
ncbi:dTDP-4-amino-4,6-dideoxygalactose transaminase [Microvirga terrestris]|uniref:dTDP-4-amino-4,6-dideoxygalactose transaminase n=1 Tax=Microvirga terrestris TaxID=2791024 RepID=A0ABS0HPE9_9HYPH|nr:dTDP-4-amino-4,6-dideoxygalactose transaminase [Microvirga terrestris]MBF9195356.1 dTDP-4-amino-4,6-dideoxygalactose transaminase [Microvirga terrestris]